MAKRKDILNQFYGQYDEENRLSKSRQGQLEFLVTMDYVHRYLNKNSKIIEIGAGTGRYSIALAKEGYDVTAVEFVKSNLTVLKKNAKGLNNLKAFQGDAINLKKFDENSFDVTLSFGPMYHLYDKKEIDNAINEAIRITKPGGVIIFAFISIYGIMYTNYCYGNWEEGMKENYSKEYKVLHFDEQLFTGYDIKEFEDLFDNKNTEYITTAAVDGILESIQKRSDFLISDKDFDSFLSWFIKFSDKRELLGTSSHLLYICKKN